MPWPCPTVVGAPQPCGHSGEERVEDLEDGEGQTLTQPGGRLESPQEDRFELLAVDISKRRGMRAKGRAMQGFRDRMACHRFDSDSNR